MQWQEKNVERRKEKGLITKPSGRAACMWGGWEALNCALQSKQVWKVEVDNLVFYQWRECNEGQIESHRGGMQTTGRRVLNQREYNEINGFLAKYQWQLDLSYAEAMGTDAGTGEHPPPLPDKILSNLNKVQNACDQAISEAKMHVRQLQVLATKLADQSSSVIAADLQKALEAPPLFRTRSRAAGQPGSRDLARNPDLGVGLCSGSGSTYGIRNCVRNASLGESRMTGSGSECCTLWN